jgi:hypothetical protein
MTHFFKTSAIVTAVIVGTASSAFAMDTDHATKVDLKFMGYSDAVVSQLTSAELSAIEATLHNGNDSDARQGVRTLIHSFTG